MSVDPAAPTPAVRLDALASVHARDAFTCGVAALDRYLRMQAGQDVAKRVSAAFVLTAPPATAVLGYYTLAAASVRLQDVPPAAAKRLPRYPHVPATLLGRLAVDARARGRGYGELLLLDALRRSLDATRAVASAAVLVDAKDDAAARFYARYGFLALPDRSGRLFLPMRTVEGLSITGYLSGCGTSLGPGPLCAGGLWVGVGPAPLRPPCGGAGGGPGGQGGPVMLAIPPSARTTPAVRAEIARATDSTGVLAARYGVRTGTVRKWRRRGPDDCADHS